MSNAIAFLLHEFQHSETSHFASDGVLQIVREWASGRGPEDANEILTASMQCLLETVPQEPFLVVSLLEENIRDYRRGSDKPGAQAVRAFIQTVIGIAQKKPS